MPPVRILDNMQLEPNDYTVKIKEVDAGRGRIFANQLMVMDPMGKEITLPGSPHDRADLRPARHMDRAGAAR